MIKKSYSDLFKKLDKSEYALKGLVRVINDMRHDAANMERGLQKEIEDLKKQLDEERKQIDHWEP